jgi:hypothetical protein
VKTISPPASSATASVHGSTPSRLPAQAPSPSQRLSAGGGGLRHHGSRTSSLRSEHPRYAITIFGQAVSGLSGLSQAVLAWPAWSKTVVSRA